jgi:DNA modification methylase
MVLKDLNMDFVCDPQSNYSTSITESTVFQGDAKVLLERLPDGFFRCCITSPPYWGLRDYGTNGQIGAEYNPEEYIDRLGGCP